MVIQHSCLCSCALFGQGQPKLGIWRAQQLLPQCAEVGCRRPPPPRKHGPEAGRYLGTSRTVSAACPYLGELYQQSVEMRLSCFFQIMAKPREESVWLKNHDWSNQKKQQDKGHGLTGREGSCCCPALAREVLQGLQTGFSPATLNSPNWALKGKPLEELGDVGEGNFPPPLVLWLLLSLWHINQAGLGEAGDCRSRVLP